MQRQNIQHSVQNRISIPIHCVMIVESDPDIALILHEVLKDESIPTMIAATRYDALQITKSLKPLLFLINASLSDGDGITLYDQIVQRMGRPHSPAIILSTNASIYKQELEKRNIRGLDIPFEIDDLTQTVLALLPPQFL